MPGPHIRRHQLASFLYHQGAQYRALRQRQPLPRFLEHGLLLAEQSRQRGMKIVDTGDLASGRPDVIPRFMGEPLDVERYVCGELDDRLAEPRLGANAAALEARFDERRKVLGIDLLQPQHRASLVEGPPRAEHALHQRWLRAGEDVTDLPLVLHRRT